MKKITVSWFSAGVSSAVATKLSIDQIDKIIYTHIDDQHPDTMRFISDCSAWFAKDIDIIQSPLKSVNNALRMQNYVNGIRGAACTMHLKRRVRKEWEQNHLYDDITYIWGLDVGEKHRAERIEEHMPAQTHLFPLIEKKLTKPQVHEILNASGIKRPEMYNMGYPNNNCIGCVKGGKGYWNKIREDFPEVFKERADTERLIGGTCINGTYLDELPPTAGRTLKPIVEDCGLFCDLIKI